MITVSDKCKYVCVWGIEQPDANTLSSYRNKGYTIVNIKSGAESIKECMKTVILSSNNT